MKAHFMHTNLLSWVSFLGLILVVFTLGQESQPDSDGGDQHPHAVDAVRGLSEAIPLREIRNVVGLPQQKLTELDEGLAQDSVEVKREAVLMGSQFVFIVEAPRSRGLAAIASAADAVRQLESEISSWKPNSDITRLNERAGISPVVVSENTFELLSIAKELSHRTLGTFDITIGAVWGIWPYRDPKGSIPSQSEIDTQLKLVNAEAIELNQEDRTAYLPIAGMKVNFGALGKGFAAGLAIQKMKSFGIKNGAVSAGGDLYLMGRRESGPWVVELEHPRWPGRYLDRFLIGDMSVATSGDAKQYIHRNGKRYGHILDPRTGWPVEGCQSVTIITGLPFEADAYATAVSVMGPVKGMKWVERQSNVEALIVDNKGILSKSSGWNSVTNPDRTLLN